MKRQTLFWDSWLPWALAMILLGGGGYIWEVDYALAVVLTAWHELGHVAGAVLSGGWVETLTIGGGQDGSTVMLGGWSLGARWMGYGGMVLWSIGVLIWGEVRPGRMLLWMVVMSWAAALLWASDVASIRILLWLGGGGGTVIVLGNDRCKRVVERTMAWLMAGGVVSEMLDVGRGAVPLDAVRLAELSGVATTYWVWSWAVVAICSCLWAAGQMVRWQEEDAAGRQEVAAWWPGQAGAMYGWLARQGRKAMARVAN